LEYGNRDEFAGSGGPGTCLHRDHYNATVVAAVAGACAANNLVVAIPYHRVVRNDGSLSGYAWGVERKRVLLDREASQNA